MNPRRRRTPADALTRVAARLRLNHRGNVAMIVALALPAFSMLAVGAVEIGFVLSDRGKLQEATDAAALATASELALAVESGALERAKAMALAQVGKVAVRSDVTAEAELVEDGAGIRVRLTAHRDSFFGNLLPPGGFTTRAESVAVGMGQTPLCILALAKKDRLAINPKDTALIRASGCLVHSNEDIKVEGSASISAGAVQSVGTTTGSVTPVAGVGAETVEDPFGLANLSGKGPCKELIDLVLTTALITLPPGRHCKKIEVKKNGILHLAPGEHYFENTELKLAENATLYGEDVALIFDKTSKFTFQDSSNIDLYGRRTGPLAGFLVVTTRDNSSDFVMMSDNIRNLLGVIYLPQTQLVVKGNNPVAAKSAWTVVVADRIKLEGSPTLVINRNYNIGGVPVPDGVGPQHTEVRLSR